MPWNENNCINDETISKFRFRSILFVSITICTMYLAGIYPRIYYLAIGDENSLEDIPAASKVIEWFHAILLLSYIIITFILQICEFRENRTSSRVPHQLHNLPRAFLIVMAIIFFLGSFTKYFGAGRLMVILQLMIIIFGVISPAWIIATSSLLRTFVKTEIINATRCINIQFLQYQLQRHFLRQLGRYSSAIEPMV